MKPIDNRQKQLQQLRVQKEPVIPSHHVKAHAGVSYHPPKETKGEEGKEAPVSQPAVPPRPRAGRNEPCPCGSGKKYKKCCLEKDEKAAGVVKEGEKDRGAS